MRATSKESAGIGDHRVRGHQAARGLFNRALGLIKSAVETSASRAACLDGSFGSGKRMALPAPVHPKLMTKPYLA